MSLCLYVRGGGVLEGRLVETITPSAPGTTADDHTHTGGPACGAQWNQDDYHVLPESKSVRCKIS